MTIAERNDMPLAATSLKIPRSLKARIERLARLSGASPHSLMVRALTEHVEAAEKHQAFVDDAVRADEAMRDAGTGYAMRDVHAYIAAKVNRRPAKRPKPVRWRG
jgi:predicted transcriptional regulator